MKILFYKLLAKLTGKNSKNTPKTVILDQMTEQRPLPIGKTQFMEWSDRIISGACVDVDVESQRFALAESIMHLPANQSFSDDQLFIHKLRRIAVNQTCISMVTEMKEAQKAKLEAKKAEEMAQIPTSVQSAAEATTARIEAQNVAKPILEN